MIVIALAAIALAAVAVLLTHARVPARYPAVVLFGTLPILWAEARTPSELLRSDLPPHWVRTAIESRTRLLSLDALTGKDGTAAIPRDALLIMAQPRALSPQENVALDDWVRGGGRVLLFADPMLTARSLFALGDKRRPQDVVLLSPILGRWGLQLQFDEGQPLAAREIALFGGALPVDLPGRFVSTLPANCRVTGEGVAAQCRIGAGQVLAIADAALLEADGDAGRKAMFARLMAVAAER